MSLKGSVCLPANFALLFSATAFSGVATGGGSFFDLPLGFFAAVVDVDAAVVDGFGSFAVGTLERTA